MSGKLLQFYISWQLWPFRTLKWQLRATLPRNMSSATCLRRLPYIWKHLRQRNSVDKIETYVTNNSVVDLRRHCGTICTELLRQHASRSPTI